MQQAAEQPIKDEENAQPIAGAWRPTLREIVRAFAEGDYRISRGIACVAPVADETAEWIRKYVAHYGETLTELPDDTWNTSVAQWMWTHWDALIDLWTVEAGASDLVLSVRIFESGDGFLFEIDSLHVP